MANPIQLKRSKAAGNKPASLADGEVAVNIPDRKLYVNDGSGNIRSVDLTGDSEKVASGTPIGNAIGVKLDATGSAEGVTGLDPATGAIARKLAARVRETHVSIVDFGAFGGDPNKDTAALQAACNWANGPNGDGRPPFIPPGRGSINQTINHYSTFTGGADIRRVGLVGQGSGVSQLVWTGAASSGNMINWGTQSTDSSQGQYNSHARVGGFTLDGASQIATGLRTFRQAWFLVDDVRLTAFTGAAYHSESCVSYSIRGMRSFLSSSGALFDKGTDSTAFTTPNAIVVIDSTFGSHSYVGIDAVDCGPLIIFGGSIEACGSSASSLGGIRITKSGNNVGIESMMAIIDGTYFENNQGSADVLFSNSSTVDVGIAVRNANFNRISSSRFTTNNILMQIQNSGRSSMDVSASGFNIAGNYARDPSRAVAAIAGNVANVGSVRWAGTNIGDKSTDAPVFNGPWDTAFSRPRVLCRYNPSAGIIVQKQNVASVTKNATGRYTVNYNFPMASANNIYVTGLIGGSGRIDVTGEAAGSVSIEVNDNSGVATDALSFSVAVYGPVN